MAIVWTEEMRKQRSEKVKAAWNNPEHRAKMLEKQRKIGLRSYGNTLTPRRKVGLQSKID